MSSALAEHPLHLNIHSISVSDQHQHEFCSMSYISVKPSVAVHEQCQECQIGTSCRRCHSQIAVNTSSVREPICCVGAQDS